MILTEEIAVRPIQKPLIEECDYATIEGMHTSLASYTFPISKPDKVNLNGRIYTTQLWEKVINEKQPVNCFGLCDHPKDTGSVKDIFCIWKNIRFNTSKSLVLSDCYLFGRLGQHCNEAILAGAEIGLSTVGNGSFDHDGKTVIDYELLRAADWVLEPSGQVFGTVNDQRKTEQVRRLPVIEEGFYKTHFGWV